MPAYREFLTRQDEKYQGMRTRGAQALVNGLTLDPAWGGRCGCVSVALSHPPKITRGVEEFSRQIAVATVGCSLQYREEHLHTTLCSGKTEGNFFFQGREELLRGEISNLARAVAPVFALMKVGQVHVDFRHYIHSDTVVIAGGEPNEEYVRLIEKLMESAATHGISLTPSIDAHMTVSRFTETVPPRRLTGLFRSLMSFSIPGSGPGMSIPDAMHVGYSHWDIDNPLASNGHFRPVYSFRFLDF